MTRKMIQHIFCGVEHLRLKYLNEFVHNSSIIIQTRNIYCLSISVICKLIILCILHINYVQVRNTAGII